ncbi:hypothetical protein C0J52_18870 [Blattella germanica]|nr:hypothetical protein C0J52_18870 [Blattella germanica]
MQQRRLGPFYLLVIFSAFVILETAFAGDSETEDSTSSEAATLPPTVQSGNEEESDYETTELAEKAEQVFSGLVNIKDAMATPAPIIGEYRVLNRDGNPCIQLQVDCTITFTYKTKSGTRDDYEYLPSSIDADGECSDDDSSLTPGRERWYVNGISLTVDTTTNKFQGINNPGFRKLVTPKEHSMLFPTPVGKSYSCQEETSVELQNGDVSAQVFLRGFKLQPFMYKKEFGPVYECSPGGMRAFRDETAPIAVGSTLAIVVLLTVTGYGVYRYFKIKKVQYDTMEESVNLIIRPHTAVMPENIAIERNVILEDSYSI